MKRAVLIFLLWGSLVSGAAAFEPFTVKDIRVEGLQRISAGTVFNYLPLKVGDRVDEARSADIVRALFRTGFFKDVRLEREGDVLVVSVLERPSIASVEITGNKSLDKDELREGLKQIGLAEGRVFDSSLLDKVEQELRRLYFSQGKYGVKLKSTVTPLERNRVGVSIEVSEGTVARIHRINIVGNNAFSDKKLLKEFELSPPTLFSFYTGNDQYSRQKLAADLERLRSYYLDRGYIDFNIDSTQVSITPDKKDVYITINVTEGDRFTVSSVKLAGDLIVAKEELFKLIDIQQGDTFSRKRATRTSSEISRRLGTEGYAFANVNVVPDIDKEKKKVALTFFVDSGKRVYVRRINFSGNTRTRDVVLRREMRQFESGWIDTEKVERSRERLQRLGYFEDVNVETPAVPGTTDQVDVNFSVKERASGNLAAGIGFSDSQGLIFNTSVTQDNFLGSGKRVSVAFNNSDVNTLYRFSYTNPYYTVNGVSRGFNFLYRQTDADEANVASFSSDVGTASMDFSIPISEFNRVGFSIGYEYTSINTTATTPQRFLDFLSDNGDSFGNFLLSGSFAKDSRDRALFPTRGGLQRVSLEFSVPGSDLEYYKLRYRNTRYLRLTRDLTLSFGGEIGYGESYGDTTELPFFENFLAGGGRSVRGFEDNTLGPKDEFGEPIGGNLLVTGSVELFFPLPFVKDRNAWRFSGFVDFGNVYGSDEDFEVSELRYSAGVGVTWLSPFGALTVSLAAPFNEQNGDETKNFQFSFGTGF